MDEFESLGLPASSQKGEPCPGDPVRKNEFSGMVTVTPSNDGGLFRWDPKRTESGKESYPPIAA